MFVRRTHLVGGLKTTIMIVTFSRGKRTSAFRHGVRIYTHTCGVLARRISFGPRSVVFSPGMLTITANVRRRSGCTISFVGTAK